MLCSGGFRAARLPRQVTCAVGAVSSWVEKNSLPPPNRRALDWSVVLTVERLCPIVPQDNIVVSNKHNWPAFYLGNVGLAQVWNHLWCYVWDTYEKNTCCNAAFEMLLRMYCIDKASHMTVFSAWDGSPHISVTPAQLVRVCWKNVSCAVGDFKRPVFFKEMWFIVHAVMWTHAVNSHRSKVYWNSSSSSRWKRTFSPTHWLTRQQSSSCRRAKLRSESRIYPGGSLLVVCLYISVH